MTITPPSRSKAFQERVNHWLSQQPGFSQDLWEELAYLRHRPLKKTKYRQQTKLDRPVAVFSKPERLKSGMGTEITVIFRSSACSWARSKSGGCTMCGYWNDRAPESITGEDYWLQFQVAVDRNQALLADPASKIVFKIFTSGSFCDPREIPEEIQHRIITALSTYPTIHEIVIESRPEYITPKRMQKYQEILQGHGKYLEIGVGLETVDNFIRTNIINKGFDRKAFLKALDILHQVHFGMKAYLLFKPPFLTEYSSLIDTYQSVRFCVEHGVDTISINPTNIQNNTLCDELQKVRAFRPPWLYSVLWLLKSSITNEELKQTRVICDPSAAGKERGVHNCTERDASNTRCLAILHEFTQTQDIHVIPLFKDELCLESYKLALLLSGL